MSRKTRDSITLTGGAANAFIKEAIASGNGPIASGATAETDAAHGMFSGGDVVSTESTDDLRTFEGTPDVAPVVRNGGDVIADLLAVKLRLEALRAVFEGNEADAKREWDRLADELGQRAKAQHLTRVPTRIGGTVYEFKFTKATKRYSLIESATPGEIK